MQANCTSKEDAVSHIKTLSMRVAHKEDGSLTIFSLFMFVLILFIAGMAVDLMRYENERVALQNTVDTAVVAASSLTQDADTEAEVIALVKEYVSKAGFDPDMVTVDPEIETVSGTIINRSVAANVNFKMDTMFMNMMGVDTLDGQTGTAAREGQQLIEVALVLDVSGSMGRNGKLGNLKTAAKDFVTTVINQNGADRVSISIVPYNQQVYMDDNLAARLAMTNATRNVTTPPLHPGAITTYQTLDTTSRCARFHTADFATRQLANTATAEASAMYSNRNIGMDAPSGNDFWCGENLSRMMLYQNDITTLHTHIDGLTASGWTAVDYGMNWGVGILDPSFAPIVTDMVDSNLLPASMAGHPVAYSNLDVLKYVVLMTDGINTSHYDLKPAFKSGPTRIWHSELLAGGDTYDGYLVEMPDNSTQQRWYVPGDPYDTSDDYFLPAAGLPADAQQWDYHALYNRFSIDAAADYFFGNSGDNAAFNAHRNAEEDSGGYGTADTRARRICTEAATNDQIEVFTVAFEAPSGAQTLLEDCASKDGNYFDVEGTQISAAFSSIAAQISQLRLTE